MSASGGSTLRIARPSDQLEAVAEQDRRGLGLDELGRFEDHDGFDGVILGHPEHASHLEFTAKVGHRVGRAPTEDHLLVLYVLAAAEWQQSCERLIAAGFQRVAAFNPYWERGGATFEDLDGYRVVIAAFAWGR